MQCALGMGDIDIVHTYREAKKMFHHKIKEFKIWRYIVFRHNNQSHASYLDD